MANRNFPSNKLYNFHVMPCSVDMQIAIGSSGAPTLSSAPGVSAVTRLAPGIYQIQLQDNYYSMQGMDSSIVEPVTGSAIDPAGAVVGSLYQISTVGNTDWATAGLPTNITAAVGVVICLAAAPASGTGRVKLISASNISAIELAGPMMNSASPASSGAIVLFSCLASSAAAPTLTMNSYTPAGTITNGTPDTFAGTPAVLTGTISAPALSRAAADPTSGSVLQIRLRLNNSSVQ